MKDEPRELAEHRRAAGDIGHAFEVGLTVEERVLVAIALVSAVALTALPFFIALSTLPTP